MLQSNSKIFTTSIFGSGSDKGISELVEKNLETEEKYLSSSPISHMGTVLPTLPSNQKIAKD
jgi:hypothetical protein